MHLKSIGSTSSRSISQISFFARKCARARAARARTAPRITIPGAIRAHVRDVTNIWRSRCALARDSIAFKVLDSGARRIDAQAGGRDLGNEKGAEQRRIFEQKNLADRARCNHGAVINFEMPRDFAAGAAAAATLEFSRVLLLDVGGGRKGFAFTEFAGGGGLVPWRCLEFYRLAGMCLNTFNY